MTRDSDCLEEYLNQDIGPTSYLEILQREILAKKGKSRIVQFWQFTSSGGSDAR